MNAVNVDLAKNANALRHSVSRLSRRLRHMRSETNTQSFSKLSILSLLVRAEAPTTIGELARQEGLQPQTLTRLIADLETDGLIDRQVDPEDRRQLPIAITEAGRALMIAMARQQNAWLGDAMEGFTATERGVIALAVALIEKVAEFEPPK